MGLCCRSFQWIVFAAVYGDLFENVGFERFGKTKEKILHAFLAKGYKHSRQVFGSHYFAQVFS